MSFINSALTVLKKHRVLLCVFSSLLLYQFIVVNNGKLFAVDEITYAFHAVDYSMGFCSKILPGAIYHALVGVYNRTAVSVYLTVLYLAFVFLLSYLLEKFALAFFAQPKQLMLLLVLFLTGPFTLSVFAKRFGMLDFYWALFFALACLFLRRKYLRCLIPLLVVLMNLTHYGAMVSYVPALLLLLLFCCVKASSGRERTVYACLFAAALLAGIGSSLYLALHDAENLVYSFEDFQKIVVDERHAASTYYDFYFYHKVPAQLKEHPAFRFAFGSLVKDGVQSAHDLFETILNQTRVSFLFDRINLHLLVNLVSVFLLAFLWRILFAYFKENKHLFKRLLAVAFAALPVAVVLLGAVFSNDNTRWLAHACILLFVSVFYVLYYDWSAGIHCAETRLFKANRWLLAVLLFFYASTVVDPYTFDYLMYRNLRS